MRKIIIQRAKGFVAALMKINFYIEDRENGHIEINGIPCRALGGLKNGEQLTVEADNNAVRIFATYPETPYLPCDVYQVEEGEEDLILVGRNVLNPLQGNPFRFDKNRVDGEKITEKGNKVAVVALSVFAVAVAVLILSIAISLFC